VKPGIFCTVVVARNRIAIGDLPSGLINADSLALATDAAALESDVPLRERVRKFEIEVLLRAIADAGGDRKLAAQRLGVGLSSLYRKLDEVGG
jgi:two-component system response regulator AtoC